LVKFSPEKLYRVTARQRPKNIQQDIVTENISNESSPPTPFGWWMSPNISMQDPANTSSLEYRFAARLKKKGFGRPNKKSYIEKEPQRRKKGFFRFLQHSRSSSPSIKRYGLSSSNEKYESRSATLRDQWPTNKHFRTLTKRIKRQDRRWAHQNDKADAPLIWKDVTQEA
jgi:hypothetical protein